MKIGRLLNRRELVLMLNDIKKNQYCLITNWVGRIINFKCETVSPNYSIGFFTFRTDLHTILHCKIYGKRLVDMVKQIPKGENIVIHRIYSDENGSIVSKVINPLGNEIISNKGIVSI